MQGTIKRINDDRGFSFIAPDDGSQDLFFHASVVEGRAFDQLREGQRVEFETGTDPRNAGRARADRVRPLEE